jgi:hypothetical protein
MMQPSFLFTLFLKQNIVNFTLFLKQNIANFTLFLKQNIVNYLCNLLNISIFVA